VERLRTYKDKHQGQRCFIIGNGPSLKRMDLSPLRHEYTFGLNRIYLLFPEIQFTTTYLVSVNRLVLEQCAADISALSMPKFIATHSRDVVNQDDDTMFVRVFPGTFPAGMRFSTNPTKWVYEGFTVTYVAMQLAYYMGFEQVILIGVDHHFTTPPPPPGESVEVISAGDDPNHFAGNYFDRGFRWVLPRLDDSERAYHLARQVYSASGREILDATLDGKLQVFPKIAFESLF
jgi:hypothetical protein